jgi:hypothetical protein
MKDLTGQKSYKNYGARGTKVCPEWEEGKLGFLNGLGLGFGDEGGYV